MKTIYWHDYETTGTSPARDRPLQFAGLRTDENLNIVGEPLVMFCKPCREVLPHPMAALITGITPQQADEQGVDEPAFIARIHEEFSQPQTCVAGYNNLRFDDEITRYTLYRNFYDPYEREWKNGNSRWDIIDMLRLTRALRPEGIAWPDNEDGSPSFRLEHLTAANGIAHEAAHDAVSDVTATIAMARLVKERQPKLYNYVFEHRQKHKVAGLLDVAAKKPFLHVSSRLPRNNAYTALMSPLVEHPTNKNAVIAWNLLMDPRPLMELDAETIRQKLYTASDDLPPGEERMALKLIHLNRCPVVATPKLLDQQAARRLAIDVELCERHWHQLQNLDLRSKLHEVFTATPFLGEGADDPEQALYAGFLPNEDKSLLGAVRRATAGDFQGGHYVFSDQRYNELLFRYRARYYPESLSGEEQQRWEELRYQLLTDPALGYLTLEAYFAEIDRVENERVASGKQGILDALREWGDQVL